MYEHRNVLTSYTSFSCAHTDTCEARLTHRAQLYMRLYFSYTAVGALGAAAEFTVAQRCVS